MNVARGKNETENSEVCEAGDEMETDSDKEHDNEINDAEIDMEIEDIEDMEVGAMENVASDIPEFVGQPGGTGDMSNKGPIDYFDLIVTEQMLMKSQNKLTFIGTSRHCTEISCTLLDKKSTHSNRTVAICFLIIAMRIIQYPKIEDYWAQYWPFSTTTFSHVMTRDRFSLVLNFLQLNKKNNQNKKGDPGYIIIGVGR